MMVFINILAMILLWIQCVYTQPCGAGCEDCRSFGCYYCRDGYYLNEEYFCEICPDSCKICYFYSDIKAIRCTLCKDEHYLLNAMHCSKCHDGCAQCTDTYTCSLCKEGWWGTGCLYSCNTCNDCIEETCSNNCIQQANTHSCKDEKSKCPEKCTYAFSGPRKSDVQTSPAKEDSTTEPHTDGPGTPVLYIVIAVVGVLVFAVVIVVVVCIKRRNHRQDQESSSQETNSEECVYAKPNKVRKPDSKTSQSTVFDLQRSNKELVSTSASELGRQQSNRVSYIVPSHVTNTALDIDDIFLETCLDESETAVTEISESTGEIKDDDTYYNVLSIQRNQIKVDQFEEYVKSKSTFDFYTEFQKFPKGLSRPFTHANKPENKVKCRYNGVYPYDTNRVKLPDKDNDFINASYIDGYTRQKEYIASLGPTKETMADFVDFWAMVWQENVEKIVMLTKLVEETKMKCEQYWPDIGDVINYGDVVVTCQRDDVYIDYILRTLNVTKGQTTRLVYQTHFLSWPDKKIPERNDVLLTLIDKVRALKSEMDGPLVVHCSAGVGRTGTFIALDILLQQLTGEGAVDVFGCVIGIRGQRVAMVQTLEQYEFIHNVLVEVILKTKSKY